MANEHLKVAQQGLAFEDVFQTQVQAKVAEGFEPKLHAQALESTLTIQFKHTVVRSMLIALNGNDEHVFRVNVEVGVRYLPTDKTESAILAHIEASYSIDYRITDLALLNNQEALDEFALKNASYHLWPFWREFAMAQAQRMNLPAVPLPMRLP